MRDKEWGMNQTTQPKSTTLRNILLGCLVVFVLVLGVGGFLVYRFIYQPLRSAAAKVMEFETLTKLNDEIRNRTDFTAPEGNLLTQEDIDRFMKVQQGMRENLQGAVTQLEQNYKDIESQGQLQNIRELFTSYTDLFNLILESKRVQVQQLNEQGFSLLEYQWVKEQILGAADLPVTGFDLSQIMNEGAATAQQVLGDIPQQNKELLEPYGEMLEQNLVFSFFGL
jgi:hypothetical protein